MANRPTSATSDYVSVWRPRSPPPKRQSQLLEILKFGIAPFITLIVAIGGWLITSNYNESQQVIAREKSRADVEIAKVNTSIKFFEILDKIPANDPVRRSNAISAAISVLPPSVAFGLAWSSLQENEFGAIEAFFSYHQEKAFEEVEKRIGRGPFFSPTDSVEQIRYDKDAERLIAFVFNNNLSDGLAKHLIESAVGDARVRFNAITNYFKQARDRTEGKEVRRELEQIKRLVENPSLDRRVKRAVAFAAGIVFHRADGDERWASLRAMVVPYFWDDLDVTLGEIPVEDTAQGYIYRRVFHHESEKRTPFPERSLLSKELLQRIANIPKFDSLAPDNIRWMMYWYTMYAPRGTESPFVTFLDPVDSVAFYEKILAWANSPDRRAFVGQTLNGLGGPQIFRSLERSPGAQRRWAELTLRFYEAHYSSNWSSAKIIREIAEKFPDLRIRISKNAKQWGFRLDN